MRLLFRPLLGVSKAQILDRTRVVQNQDSDHVASTFLKSRPSPILCFPISEAAHIVACGTFLR